MAFVAEDPGLTFVAPWRQSEETIALLTTSGF